MLEVPQHRGKHEATSLDSDGYPTYRANDLILTSAFAFFNCAGPRFNAAPRLTSTRRSGCSSHRSVLAISKSAMLMFRFLVRSKDSLATSPFTSRARVWWTSMVGPSSWLVALPVILSRVLLLVRGLLRRPAAHCAWFDALREGWRSNALLLRYRDTRGC